MANKEFKVKHGLDVANGQFVVTETTTTIANDLNVTGNFNLEDFSVGGKSVYPDTTGLTVNSTAEDFPVGQSFFSGVVDGATGIVTSYKDSESDTVRQIFQGSLNGAEIARTRIYGYQYLNYQKEYDASVYTVGMTGNNMNSLQYSGSDVGQYWISSTSGDGGNAFFVNANNQIEIDGQIMADDGYQWAGLYFQWRLSPDSNGGWSFPVGVYPGDFDVYIEVSDFSGTPVVQPDNGLGSDFKMAWAGVLVGIWYDGPGPNSGEETGIGLCELADHPTLPDGSYWGVLYDGRYYNPRPDYDTFIPRNPSITSAKLRITMERDEPNNQTYYRYWYSHEQDDKGNDIWVNVVTKTDDDFFSDGHGATQGIMNGGEAGDFHFGVLGGADVTAKFNNYKFSAQNLYCDDGILEGTYISNASGIALQPAGFTAWKDLTTDTLLSNPLSITESATFGDTVTVEGKTTFNDDVTINGFVTINGYVDAKFRKINILDKGDITYVKGLANQNTMSPSIIDIFKGWDSQYGVNGTGMYGSVTYDIVANEVNMSNSFTGTSQTLKLNLMNWWNDGSVYVVPYNSVSTTGSNIVTFTAGYDGQNIKLYAVSTSGNRVLINAQRQAHMLDLSTPKIEFITNRTGYDQFYGSANFSQYPDGNYYSMEWAYEYLDGTGNGSNNNYYVYFGLYKPSLVTFDPKVYDYVTSLTCYDNYVTEVNNLYLLQNITSLQLYNNSISGELDLTLNPNLYYIQVQGNQLTSLSVGTGSPNAYYIQANNNQIGEFYFTNAESVSSVNLSNNPLKKISVTNNTNSYCSISIYNTTLDDPSNDDSWGFSGYISGIDMSSEGYNTNNISNSNSLAYLIGQGNGVMNYFYIGGTKMTSMDFNTYNTTFQVSGNEIDIHYNQLLTQIIPFEKQDSSWYVWNCPALTSISFNNFEGGLSSLQITNTAIVDETAFGNMSGMVNGSGNAMQYFRVTDNANLISLDMSNVKINQIMVQANPLMNNFSVEPTAIRWFMVNDCPNYQPIFTYFDNVQTLQIGNTTYSTHTFDLSPLTGMNNLYIYNLYEDGDVAKYGIKGVPIIDLSSNANLWSSITIQESPDVTSIIWPETLNNEVINSVSVDVGSCVFTNNGYGFGNVYVYNKQGSVQFNGCSINYLSMSDLTQMTSCTFTNNPQIGYFNINSCSLTNPLTVNFSNTNVYSTSNNYIQYNRNLTFAFGDGFNCSGQMYIQNNYGIGVSFTGSSTVSNNGFYIRYQYDSSTMSVDGSTATNINMGGDFYVAENYGLKFTAFKLNNLNLEGRFYFDNNGNNYSAASFGTGFDFEITNFNTIGYNYSLVTNNVGFNKITFDNGVFSYLGSGGCVISNNQFVPTGQRSMTFNDVQINGDPNNAQLVIENNTNLKDITLSNVIFNSSTNFQYLSLNYNSFLENVNITAGQIQNSLQYLYVQMYSCYALTTLNLTDSKIYSINIDNSKAVTSITGLNTCYNIQGFTYTSITNDGGDTYVQLSSTLVDQIITNIYAAVQLRPGWMGLGGYIGINGSKTTAVDSIIASLINDYHFVFELTNFQDYTWD